MSRSLPLRRLLPAALLSSLAVSLALLAQAPAGQKYALLVGVREYDSVKFPKLAYTENDAEDLAAVLEKKAGYSVHVLTTARGAKDKKDLPTVDNLRAAVKTLLSRKKRSDTILVALAGHGMQARIKESGIEKDESFFCPSDAQVNDTETLLGLTKLFADLDACGAGVKLLLVDACRNDPGSRGFRNFDTEAVPRPARGIAALFSCSSGQRAFETDELGGRGHGVFFHFILDGLKGKAKNSDNEVTWARLAEHVTRNVNRTVPKLIGGGAKQTPHEIKNLEGESPVLIALSGSEFEREKVIEKPGKEKVVKGGTKEITNSIGMKLVRIPAGKFMMGSTKAEQDEAIADYEKTNGSKPSDAIIAIYRAEGPRHQVEITKDFYLGIHEVTQAQYRKVMDKNPSYFCADGGGKDKVKDVDTDDFPVEQVSYEEAVVFCTKLSDLAEEKRAGRTYRLPTEAEWEYSCRGGAASSQTFHFGNSLSGKQANFDSNYPFGGADKSDPLNRTCKVGSYDKNGFGLHDMHGNVAEWCSDWYGEDYYAKSKRGDPKGPDSGSARVIRGGGWYYRGQSCRSANRLRYGPGNRGSSLGFRAAQVSSEDR